MVALVKTSRLALSELVLEDADECDPREAMMRVEYCCLNCDHRFEIGVTDAEMSGDLTQIGQIDARSAINELGLRQSAVEAAAHLSNCPFRTRTPCAIWQPANAPGVGLCIGRYVCVEDALQTGTCC